MSLLLLFSGGGTAAPLTLTGNAAVIQHEAPAGAVLALEVLALQGNAAVIAFTAPAGAALGIATVPTTLNPNYDPDTNPTPAPIAGTYQTPEDAPGWVVHIVERDGTFVRALVNTNVESVEEGVGIPTVGMFTFPKYDPPNAPGQGADVVLDGREAQIYLDGDLKVWGTMLVAAPSSDRGDVPVTVQSPDWIFPRLRIERPRRNGLLNPDFEVDPIGSITVTGWEPVNCSVEVIASPRRLGAKAIRLTQTVTGADAFLRQYETVTAGGVGDLVTLAAHRLIESFTGPALDSRGLGIVGLQNGNVRTAVWDQLDAADALALNTWADPRPEATIWVPPLETWTLEHRLGVPNGSAVYDACQSVRYESTGRFNGDVADLASDFVRFVQQPGNGKVNLHLGVDAPATGVVLAEKFLQHADAAALDVELDQLLEVAGAEAAIMVTPVTKTWTLFPAGIGTDRSATVTLAYTPGDRSRKIANYRGSVSLLDVETDVLVKAPISGPAGEEGRAVDTSEVDLVLQGVYRARAGTGIAELPSIAAARARRTHRLANLPTITSTPGDDTLVHTVRRGDIITLSVDDGWSQIPAQPFRIARKRINWDRTVVLAVDRP